MEQSWRDSWQAPDGLSVETLLAALSKVYVLADTSLQTATVVYADSHDWRLYEQGYLFYCQGCCWTLYHRDQKEIPIEQECPELHEICFARDFHPGRLRRLPESFLGIRCLMSLTTVYLEKHEVCLYRADKTMAGRLVFETQQPVGGQRYHLICLSEVSGFSADAAHVRHILAAAGVHRLFHRR
ncbi:MAG: hypothetical protein GXY53_03230 [Desulfobulbus sp.]|nr:hypothetical protein [Desulfobulbus sp.]